MDRSCLISTSTGSSIFNLRSSVKQPTSPSLPRLYTQGNVVRQMQHDPMHNRSGTRDQQAGSWQIARWDEFARPHGNSCCRTFLLPCRSARWREVRLTIALSEHVRLVGKNGRPKQRKTGRCLLRSKKRLLSQPADPQEHSATKNNRLGRPDHNARALISGMLVVGGKGERVMVVL